MVRNEFKPPSDYVADDGGGKSSIWKWLGIGCAVIALIIGGLLAAGTWKTVSCCSEAMDSARLTMRAGEFGTEFGRDLAGGHVQQARAKMTDELQASVSAEQLEGKLAEHRRFLDAGPPRLSNLFANQDSVDGPPTWSLTVEFASPSGQQKLVVLTEVVSRGEGDDQRFLVDDLRFEERARQLSSEPPAVEVLDFHRELRAEEVERAYRHMSREFTEQSSLEAFRNFVRDQQEVFRSGEVTIESVAYRDGDRAQVVANVTGQEGQRARIDYELVRPNPGLPKWLIAGVTPTYELDESEPAQPDSADAGGADTDGDVGADEPGVDEASPPGDDSNPTD